MAVHFAPPCSTFSRARDRSTFTKLRSSTHPGGLPSLSVKQRETVNEANDIAKNTYDLPWLSGSMCAVVTLENPAGSYLWKYFELIRPRDRSKYEDASLSQCMFGTPYKRQTVIRVWNSSADRLARTCSKSPTGLSCKQSSHSVLEWQGLPTREAAAYPPRLCSHLAKFLVDSATSLPTTTSIRKEARPSSQGPVKRHKARDN
jgi:hypothetical protein